MSFKFLADDGTTDTSGDVTLDANNVVSNNNAQAIVHVTGHHPIGSYPQLFTLVIYVTNNPKVLTSTTIFLQARIQPNINTSCPPWLLDSLTDAKINPKDIHWYTKSEFKNSVIAGTALWNTCVNAQFHGTMDASQATAYVVVKDVDKNSSLLMETSPTNPKIVYCNLYALDGNPLRDKSPAPPKSEQSEIISVGILHELGHCLGLDHNYGSPASLMFPLSTLFRVYGTTAPTQDAINEVNTLYP